MVPGGPRPSLSAAVRFVVNDQRVNRAKRVKGGGGVWTYYVVGERQEDGRAEVEFRHMTTGETRRALVRIATELPTLPPPEAPKRKPAGKPATASGADPRDVITRVKDLPGAYVAPGYEDATFNETAIHYAKVVGPEIFTPDPEKMKRKRRAKLSPARPRAKQRR